MYLCITYILAIFKRTVQQYGIKHHIIVELWVLSCDQYCTGIATCALLRIVILWWRYCHSYHSGIKSTSPTTPSGMILLNLTPNVPMYNFDSGNFQKENNNRIKHNKIEIAVLMLDIKLTSPTTNYSRRSGSTTSSGIILFTLSHSYPAYIFDSAQSSKGQQYGIKHKWLFWVMIIIVIALCFTPSSSYGDCRYSQDGYKVNLPAASAGVISWIFSPSVSA